MFHSNLPPEGVKNNLIANFDLEATDIDGLVINENTNNLIIYLTNKQAWIKTLRSNITTLLIELQEEDNTIIVPVFINRVPKLSESSDPSIKKLYFSIEGEKVKQQDKYAALTTLITKHFNECAIIYGGGVNTEKTSGNKMNTGFIFTDPTTEYVLLNVSPLIIGSTHSIKIEFKIPTKPQRERPQYSKQNQT